MSETHSSELQQTIAKGLPASAGIATGLLVLDREEVLQFSENGEDVVYVRAQMFLMMFLQCNPLRGHYRWETDQPCGNRVTRSEKALHRRVYRFEIKPDGVEFISGPTVTFIQKGSRLSINGSTGEILHSASATRYFIYSQLVG